MPMIIRMFAERNNNVHLFMFYVYDSNWKRVTQVRALTSKTRVDASVQKRNLFSFNHKSFSGSVKRYFTYGFTVKLLLFAQYSSGIVRMQSISIQFVLCI